jgi:hypothetical protein
MVPHHQVVLSPGMRLRPAVTGKTELAKALAARADQSMFAAGKPCEASDEDDNGVREQCWHVPAVPSSCSMKPRICWTSATDATQIPKVFLHRTLERCYGPAMT